MFASFRRHKRSVVLTWLLSYVTILLLPVCLSVVVYTQSSKTLESEIHQANNSLLKQVREVMDNYFQAMERLNIEMTWNVRVQDLLYSNKYHNYPNEFNYDLYQITQDLKLYKSAYSQLDFFYIYLAQARTVLTPGMVRGETLAYETIHANPAFPFAQWSAIVQRQNFRGFLPMTRIGEDGSLRRAVAFVSAYASEKDGAVATNVILLDQKRILGAVENMELFNEGRVFILNGANELLVSNGNEPIPDGFPVDGLQGASGLLYYKQGDKKYEVLYIASDKSGLKYVSMIPSSLYWQKAEHVRNLTYASIFISLLGGGLLTTFFLRRNYNPVRQLVQSFSGKAALDYGKGTNEFQFLERAFTQTLLEMDNIQDRMKQQRHILRSNFIGRLLKGRLDSQLPVDESLTTFHMQFDSERFVVVLFHVEASGGFYDRLPSMDDGDKLRLLQFIITNVTEESFARIGRGYMAEVDEALACLICLAPGDEAANYAELRGIVQEVQTFLREHYYIHLTLSVSEVQHGRRKIAQAYAEALDAMEYKLVTGSKEIIFYGELRKEETHGTGNGYYYPLQIEQQLINYVKTGDFEKAKQTLDEVIGRNVNRPAVSLPLVRCLMLDLAGTMMKTVSEIGELEEHALLKNALRIEQLASCETIQDMQQQMTELLSLACQYTAGKRQQKLLQSRQRALEELVANIQTYIGEHYTDPNLNISTIGHHFDMKPTYLSKLFKDQTGEGMLDAINKVRIASAKRLMEERQHNVNEVAGSVGFNDVTAFIRTYKKYEGITPGKYKESLDI